MIKPWPNTYTFTKNLAERTLKKRRGNISLHILRPAIIVAAYREPFPGWIDALTAASPIILLVAHGVLTKLKYKKKGVYV